MSVDPMEGLRGMLHEDATALIKECAAQAGITSTEDFKPLGWNLLYRVADAAHKAGAREREAALSKPPPPETPNAPYELTPQGPVAR